MANHKRIYSMFERAGYLKVPSFYSKGHDNHCRICGWENMDGTRTCMNCYSRQCRDGKAGKKIRGLSVESMSMEDYMIFCAIADGKTADIEGNVTIDEYAEEVKARNAQRIKDYQEKARLQQQRDATLFD